MPKRSTLPELFSDLAAAIRKKTGETSQIVADDFPTVIDSIPKGYPNGKTWTRTNITSGTFYCVHNANGLWVAGSGNGPYYSTDGKTWTQSNITSGTFYSLHNANGLWVAGSEGNGLYHSLDGKTWSQSNITSGYFQSIHNANGIWVAGSDGYGIYYSVTWEP